ncbi:MAG: transketolase [Chloroflexi bacterium RBG_16_57_9]|nr:MAG: transketolase [Chloroflexi bacterium RBG_16_57_9]
MAEGSVWEAIEHAAFYKLDNLIGIVDVNRLGQRGETMLGWNTEAYARRAEVFGWRTILIDGHDPQAIDQAYRQAKEATGRPTLILARTLKGKGVSFIEDKNGWHGRPLKPEEATEAFQELGPSPNIKVDVQKPERTSNPASLSHLPEIRPLQLPTYDGHELVATRKAYGDVLKALGAARPDVVALDGEVGNSTYAEEFGNAYPDRYFEMYIAEQQMIAAAIGLQVRRWKPFAATFAAFLTRAYDFIRMAAISRANLLLCGSHAGVSIGEDGPSQMALEDLAMMRAVGGSTVLYPCDANQTARLVAQMVDREGIVYIRTTREKTPILYSPEDEFPVGGSKVVRRSERDQVAVIAAGITVHEALQAYDQLKSEGIHIRVLDAYSVKPIDTQSLLAAARDTGGRLVVVEDHWAEGGLGDAVLAAFADAGEVQPRVVKLAVREMPGSGKPGELMDAAGISSRHIVAAAKALSPIGLEPGELAGELANS